MKFKIDSMYSGHHYINSEIIISIFVFHILTRLSRNTRFLNITYIQKCYAVYAIFAAIDTTFPFTEYIRINTVTL